MSGHGRFLGFVVGLLVASQCPAVIGDVIVGSLDVEVHGNAPINHAAILSHIKIKEGDVFKQEFNDASIRSLYATGLFDHIEVLTDAGVVDNAIDVRYVLYPRCRIGHVLFQGNQKISQRKLRAAIKTRDGNMLNPSQIMADRLALEDFYRKRGYADVHVSQDTSGEADSPNADLVFVISEGPRLPIGQITFEGNKHVHSRELKKLMHMRRRTPISILDGSGYYLPELLKTDLEKLRHFYRNRGFLDCTIDMGCVRRDVDAKGQMRLIIAIDEGDRLSVGNISISGNTVYDSTRLLKCVALHSGDWFSPDKISQAEDAIRNLYGRAGYMESYVTAKRRPNLEGSTIDLDFVVHESEKTKVGFIHIRGNTKTKHQVILRELSLTPGETFNLIKLRNSENRLRETRYFGQVVLSPEASSLPNSRDICIAVEEGSTGRFHIGGAMSSLENIVGTLEVGQSNFDLAGHRVKWQGAGQKFRTRLDVGTRTQQATVSFEEPWLFQRELAFGLNTFYLKNEHRKSDHNYGGESYDERHKGFDLYLRKRIVELLEGNSYYKLDRVELYNVAPNAPMGLRIESSLGAQWVSKAGISLQRDCRDTLLYPTLGNKVVGTVDFAGLGGDVHYLNLDFQFGQWLKLSDYHTQTLAFLGKMGTMKPYRRKYIPYFDRKFLGGSEWMRGFEFQGVGPRDGYGGAVGANGYVYGALEYSFKVTDQFRLALFTEGAYTGRKFMCLDQPFYNDIGVELRLFVMNAPLRLIFGYPTHGDKYYPHKLQFNFAFSGAF
ncbi:MAG: outer membrane protein assembly factor BamA [Puniceicoccales bacterium]|jgi:outer membrane protein insertion porin family|nr:outer membrane protein assembly factor BamA [Puniceicoccales bacterium]